MNKPTTIKYPDTFDKSPAAGFDGIFDWSWTQGCFGEGKITPMDFDGVVERKGNFIIFETKDINVPVPKGQLITLESAYALGCFTILFIEGKSKPEKVKAWCQKGFKNGKKMESHKDIKSIESLRNFVSGWYQHADNNPYKPVDVTFLNRKISGLEISFSYTREHLTKAINALGGDVDWGEL